MSHRDGRSRRRLGAVQGALATRTVVLTLVVALGAVLGAVALATGAGSALLGEGVAHAQAAPAQVQAQSQTQTQVPVPATPAPRVDVGGVLPLPRIDIGVEPARSPKDVSVSLQILALLTVLTLAPAILIMLTSFTRIVIVLSFVRSALGSQQVPPNQVLIGLALFLTFFVMAPALGTANEQALQPYLRGEISQQVALDRAAVPFREFMLKQTRERDLALFTALAKAKRPANPSEVPMLVLIPAFTISELKTAFEIGFLIYVPFLVIDMVVASVLMSMGMLMLPPVMISLPFKLLLFVMVDGWNLVIGSLLRSFH
ncbi:MAG: flagellar type III secretion system pore protein FliP [Firmicutes bacterium]|nr:flagellar type III secretion system pore protein FliP [Bacillota bacterium]